MDINSLQTKDKQLRLTPQDGRIHPENLKGFLETRTVELLRHINASEGDRVSSIKCEGFKSGRCGNPLMGVTIVTGFGLERLIEFIVTYCDM